MRCVPALTILVSPASKFMIATGAGVIDSDYRGIVYVLLFNHSDKDFEGGFAAIRSSVTYFCIDVVKQGDRIAQLILERCEHPPVIEVEVRVPIVSVRQAISICFPAPPGYVAWCRRLWFHWGTCGSVV